MFLLIQYHAFRQKAKKATSVAKLCVKRGFRSALKCGITHCKVPVLTDPATPFFV